MTSEGLLLSKMGSDKVQMWCIHPEKDSSGICFIWSQLKQIRYLSFSAFLESAWLILLRPLRTFFRQWCSPPEQRAMRVWSEALCFLNSFLVHGPFFELNLFLWTKNLLNITASLSHPSGDIYVTWLEEHSGSQPSFPWETVELGDGNRERCHLVRSESKQEKEKGR